MTAVTDLAQTVEPTRRDIGVMGIGAPQPDPSPDELARIDTRNKAAMEARVREQAAQRAALLTALKRMVGAD
jgi:hypothetical protein